MQTSRPNQAAIQKSSPNTLENYQELIERYAALMHEMQALAHITPPLRDEQQMPASECPDPLVADEINPPDNNNGTVLIFAPHPDDECIMGALPLRMKAAGFRIVNVAVTLGSKKERQLERLEELRHACTLIGYDLILTGDRCLDGVNENTRINNPDLWQHNVEIISAIITQEKPGLIIMPHEHDAHKTHRGTYLLVADALKKIAAPVHVALTEFWSTMEIPNLMVEVSENNLAVLMAGICCHRGEVERNPYHAFLPAWLHDSVRRGSELLNGVGTPVSPIHFAALYKLLLWNGRTFDRLKNNKILLLSDSAYLLFKCEK